MNIADLTLNKLAQELRLAAKNCQCEGTRETTFTARGRDNIVNCLRCEPLYKLLEPIELALAILQEAQ